MTSNGAHIYKAKKKDYDKFVFDPRNRPLRPLKKLIESMREYGFIKGNAIMVKKDDDGKLVIMQGAHRYAAAAALGIPFYYTIEDGDIDVRKLEVATKSWSLKDYVMSYVNLGVRDYQDLEYYNRRTGIPLSKCIRILGESGSWSRAKDGGFRVADEKKRRADDIGQIVLATREHVGVIGKNGAFVQAVIDLAHLPHFRPKRMIHKIKTFPGKVKIMDGVDGYRRMLEALYNHKCSAHTKADLAFPAKRAADERARKK